jgi:hypothetical protein
MTKSSLMSSTALSQDLEELLAETAGADIPVETRDLSSLVQAISKELVVGDPRYVPGAAAGDFILPRKEERIPVKGEVGYSFLILDTTIGFPEYRPDRGGFVQMHDEKPRNAVWHKKGVSPDGKEGLYLVDIDGKAGNRIEETIYNRVLVLPDDRSAPFVVTQTYKSTAKPIGNGMLNRTTRKVDGKSVNPVTVKWRMKSRKERSGDDRWYMPDPQWLGRLGEPNGPTPEEVHLAAHLRKAIKTGASWEGPLEVPTPPNLSGPSAPLSPSAQHRPAITITSGRQTPQETAPQETAPRETAPRETAPPIDQYDAPNNDNADYDNIPF